MSRRSVPLTRPRAANHARRPSSPATGTACTEGLLVTGQVLAVDVESEGLVASGDGLESDRLTLTWGQRVGVGAAARTLQLVC